MPQQLHTGILENSNLTHHQNSISQSSLVTQMRTNLNNQSSTNNNALLNRQISSTPTLAHTSSSQPVTGPSLNQQLIGGVNNAAANILSAHFRSNLKSQHIENQLHQNQMNNLNNDASASNTSNFHSHLTQQLIHQQQQQHQHQHHHHQQQHLTNALQPQMHHNLQQPQQQIQQKNLIASLGQNSATTNLPNRSDLNKIPFHNNRQNQYNTQKVFSNHELNGTPDLSSLLHWSSSTAQIPAFSAAAAMAANQFQLGDNSSSSTSSIMNHMFPATHHQLVNSNITGITTSNANVSNSNNDNQASSNLMNNNDSYSHSIHAPISPTIVTLSCNPLIKQQPHTPAPVSSPLPIPLQLQQNKTSSDLMLAHHHRHHHQSSNLISPPSKNDSNNNNNLITALNSTLIERADENFGVNSNSKNVIELNLIENINNVNSIPNSNQNDPFTRSLSASSARSSSSPPPSPSVNTNTSNTSLNHFHDNFQYTSHNREEDTSSKNSEAADSLEIQIPSVLSNATSLLMQQQTASTHKSTRGLNQISPVQSSKRQRLQLNSDNNSNNNNENTLNISNSY